MNKGKRFVTRKKDNSFDFLIKQKSDLLNQNSDLLNYIQFFKKFPEYLKNLIVLKDSRNGYKPCGYIFQDALTGIVHYNTLNALSSKIDAQKELLKLYERFSDKSVST